MGTCPLLPPKAPPRKGLSAPSRLWFRIQFLGPRLGVWGGRLVYSWEEGKKAAGLQE